MFFDRCETIPIRGVYPSVISACSVVHLFALLRLCRPVASVAKWFREFEIWCIKDHPLQRKTLTFRLFYFLIKNNF